MTSVFLLFLFILQILTFYFLALLYTKVSKFDALEKKQQRLMEEMDDSLAAYLSEVKDENDQLIKKLASVESNQQTFKKKSVPIEKQETEEKRPEQAPLIDIVTPKMPLNLALKSYASMKPEVTHEETIEELPIDSRARIIQLYEDGKSVEDIARILGKGQTEIELILKFRQ